MHPSRAGIRHKKENKSTVENIRKYVHRRNKREKHLVRRDLIEIELST
jgi:hypothetical protein